MKKYLIVLFLISLLLISGCKMEQKIEIGKFEEVEEEIELTDDERDLYCKMVAEYEYNLDLENGDCEASCWEEGSYWSPFDDCELNEVVDICHCSKYKDIIVEKEVCEIIEKEYSYYKECKLRNVTLLESYDNFQFFIKERL